jgi:hypothetical protein
MSAPSSTPNIFIFVVDTLRPDYVNAKDAPNMYSFKQKYVAPKKIISTATATQHALYGLFFSRLPYERKPMINRGWDIGAPTLQILKNYLGYSVRPYGVPSDYFCNASTIPASEVRAESANVQLIFGVSNALLSSCNNTPANLMTGSLLYQFDMASLDRFVAELPTVIAPNPKQFALIHIESPHPKFSWPSDLANQYTPNLHDTNVLYETAQFRPTNGDIIVLRKV